MSWLEEELPYEQVLARIADLAEELTNHPDRTVAERSSELLDWVDAFHRDGLGRLVDMIRAWRGELFLEAVASDPVAGILLEAYGLGEGKDVDAEAVDAVSAALEEIRPYAESHGGTIELDSIVDGVVRVRMLGACDGCPSSAVTLTSAVEQAVRERWPHLRRLELVDDAPAAEESSALPDPEPVLLQIRGHEGR